MSKKIDLWKSMPNGTAALFFIQIVATLSFSVLYSTLVLYMKGKLGIPVATANSIMGVFIAFNFALHLLGGFWGGRLMSNRALFCVGMIAQVIGCVLLSFATESFLYYGLAAFLTGSGLNVTCINCMLTQMFSPEDNRRETAFLWNYAGMNVGFFIGFTLSGIFQISQNYQRLFLLSSLGNLIAVLICFYFWQQLSDINTAYSKKTKEEQRKSIRYGILFVMMLPLAISQLLQFSSFANKLVILTGVLMLLVIIYLAYQQPNKIAKDKIIGFTILMFVGTVFWMLYQIGPMGLTVFIDNNVQRHFGDWVIAPQWFQNINTIVIVFGGPLLGIMLNRMRQNGSQINIPAQFAYALLFIGVAFAILPIGIAYANHDGMVNPSWVVTSFVLQSIGELLISPIGYAMIGALAPSSLQGVMMGMWMLNTGVGATLSSYSSNLMIVGQNSSSPLLTNSGYSNVFLILGLFAIFSSMVVFILVPKLRKLTNENKLSDRTDSVKSVSSNRVALCE
jgi:POT family proton-dependent oligopeptide transporter